MNEDEVVIDVNIFVDEIEVKEYWEEMYYCLYYTPSWALEPLTV